MKSKTLYIITSGSYSDYRLEAVFDSKELAEKYEQAFKISDSNGVEEITLNPHCTQLTKGLLPFVVDIKENGDAEEGIHYTKYGDYLYFYGKEYLQVHCLAKNLKHAIKIANEKRVQLLAINKWGDNGYLNQIRK